MLLADSLSRLCSPSSGFFDPTLPAKLQALLRYLPNNMKNHENVRVYAFNMKTNISDSLGLFENSLSNKGQLSAWRIAETADLQSIVQTHYSQGSKMLLADSLSRLCSPSSGFFDPTLPAKLQALLRYLPDNMKNHENVRVYAFKDTAALSRHIQQWRTPKNPINQGRLSYKSRKIILRNCLIGLKRISNLQFYVLLESFRNYPEKRMMRKINGNTMKGWTL